MKVPHFEGAGPYDIGFHNGAIYNGGSKVVTHLYGLRQTGRSLAANPFRGKTFKQIGNRLEQRGFSSKGTNPVNGVGSYFHPNSGRKYYMDQASGKSAIKGAQCETPHVDVHRIIAGENVKNAKDLPHNSKFTDAKRKYPLGDELYVSKNKHE